jgi:hypothetical protein
MDPVCATIVESEGHAVWRVFFEPDLRGTAPYQGITTGRKIFLTLICIISNLR